MKDLTERLRSTQNPGLAVRQQAADALERLTAENAAFKAQLAYAASTGDECAIEVEALRKDAERYRWLRDRLEVRPQKAMSGSVRDALTVRIGCSFLDSEVSKRRSLKDPDAHENGCKQLDAAIDAAMEQSHG